jgi:hypothetical protein
MNRLVQQIVALRRRAEAESAQPGSSAYLPGVVGILNELERSVLAADGHQREIIGGLFRLVTDDLSFARSDLGEQILKLCDDLA